MAQSDEELKLKKRARRRLIGAVALVILVVVFLPMLLDREPRQLGQEFNIQIPPVQNGDNFASRIVPVPGAQEVPSPPPVPAAASKPQPTESSLVQRPAEKASAPAPAPPPAAKAVAPSAATEAAGPVPESYVVQLGAFSKEANAKQVAAKLSQSKVKFYTERISAPSGSKIRVRAGPFVTREEAERVRDKLRRLGLNGTVGAKE